MPIEAENRFSERYQLSAEIKYASPKSEDVRKATIINCSEGGVYLEAAADLKPGTPVFIANAHDSKFFRAKVVWRRRLARSGGSVFGFGIKYLDPPPSA